MSRILARDDNSDSKSESTIRELFFSRNFCARFRSCVGAVVRWLAALVLALCALYYLTSRQKYRERETLLNLCCVLQRRRAALKSETLRALNNEFILQDN